MAMAQAEIEKLIHEGIPDAEVKVSDLRGDGDHYAVYIASPAFKGKSRVQQHQLVYKALQGKMADDLHALAIQTAVPDDK